jgi:AraC-like DNA-binding protein
VDLACRHLALAAAINIFAPVPKSPRSPEDPKGKRRRRGGVLGFKELAAKSKLSAWHFHRVFKLVTGLTPKTYGDKCWEYLKTIKDEQSDVTPASSLLSISGMTRQRDDFASSNTSSPTDEPSPKRVKMESASPAFTNAPPPFDNSQLNWDIPELSPSLGKQDLTMPQTTFDLNFDLKTEQPDLNLSLKPEPSHMTDFDTEVPNYVKSVSVPDLTKYNPKPPSLFSHSKNHTISPSSQDLPMTLTAPSDKLTMPTMDTTYNMMMPELNEKNDDPVIDELYNFPLSFEIEGNGLDIMPEFISTPAI